LAFAKLATRISRPAKRSQEEAENEIKAAFDDHECKLTDSSQSAQRIVRDFTQDE
jgi:hypothetical protein